MNTLINAAIAFLSVFSTFSHAQISATGPLEGNYSILLQESGLDAPLRIEGETLVVTIPPPYPILDTAHTTMDSQGRLSATMQESAKQVRNIFAASMKACKWDRRLEGKYLVKHYEEMYECASKANDDYLQNFSSLINAYLDAFKEHYAKSTERSLYHRQLAHYQLMFIPITKQHWEMENYLSFHRLIGRIFEEKGYKKDKKSPYGIVSKDTNFQKRIDNLQSAIQESEIKMNGFMGSFSNSLQCIANM